MYLSPLVYLSQSISPHALTHTHTLSLSIYLSIYLSLSLSLSYSISVEGEAMNIYVQRMPLHRESWYAMFAASGRAWALQLRW